MVVAGIAGGYVAVYRTQRYLSTTSDWLQRHGVLPDLLVDHRVIYRHQSHGNQGSRHRIQFVRDFDHFTDPGARLRGYRQLAVQSIHTDHAT